MVLLQYNEYSQYRRKFLQLYPYKIVRYIRIYVTAQIEILDFAAKKFALSGKVVGYTGNVNWFHKLL